VRALQPAAVVKQAAKVFEITEDQLLGRSREQEIVFARHVTALVLRDMGLTDAAIGRRLKRDRTTARDGYLRAEELLPIYPWLQYAYEELLMQVVRPSAP
jgi:chromosomal replication initiation ATPase DnaA